MFLAMRSVALIFFSLVVMLPACSPAPSEAEDLVPYKLYTLDNGLTLIVHEDKKAPLVAVNVWYHVCLLYTSPSPRDGLLSRMPSSA